MNPAFHDPVLLVEDDPALGEALSITLRLNQIDHELCTSAEAAAERLAPGSHALLVSDCRLPGMSGLELLDIARERAPDLPVVLMTAFADAHIAVRALKSGARDFLIKPFMPEHLLEVIARHRRRGGEAASTGQVVAASPTTLAVLSRSDRVAGTDATVLLTGESGVGKDVLARYLHQMSQRANRPFVAINCAAIPETLLEATLFGHEKGSFTGATRQQPGKFEQADGGTLFLDEIGEMPFELQAKLLRVLQDRTVERLGATRSIETDVRLIAATNRDLLERVRAGKFREDLYFRLAVFPIRIPPLRERPEDIPALANTFISRYGKTMGREGVRLSLAAEAALQSHRWPGNVRELENAIQRALLLCDGNVIEPSHLELVAFSQPPAEKTGPNIALPSIEAGNSAISAEIPSRAAANIAAFPANSAGPSDISALEREHILRVLASVGGSRKKAIEALGISERTLRYKIKAYREQGFQI